MKTTKLFLLFAALFNFAYAGFDTLFVEIQGNKAVIWHKNTESNCVSKFVFEVKGSADTIVIVERDTVGPLVDCNCLFDLSVTIENLTGTHVVVVYRQDLKIYHYPNDTTYFIGSTSFTLPISMLPYFSITGFQSGCGGVPVGVKRTGASPMQSVRLINHPNPFNSSTTISFFISEGIAHSTVELNVYDERGQRIRQLMKSVLPPGEHATSWDATDGGGRAVASGVYFYHLIVGTERWVGKMSLVK